MKAGVFVFNSLHLLVRFKRIWTISFLMVLCNGVVSAQSLEVRVLEKINAGSHPHWDKAMLFTSHSIYAAAPLSFSTAWYLQYKKDKKFFNQNAWSSAGALGLTAGVATALKFAIERPRPFVKHPLHVIQRDQGVGSYSFPSGHTSVAFVSATIWSLSANKWYVTAMAYSYASLVGYSRLRLGVHYPSDVLTGALLGVGSGYLSWYLVKQWHKKRLTKSSPSSITTNN